MSATRERNDGSPDVEHGEVPWHTYAESTTLVDTAKPSASSGTSMTG